jgi:hypothetical protein
MGRRHEHPSATELDFHCHPHLLWYYGLFLWLGFSPLELGQELAVQFAGWRWGRSFGWLFIV